MIDAEQGDIVLGSLRMIIQKRAASSAAQRVLPLHFLSVTSDLGARLGFIALGGLFLLVVLLPRAF